MATGEPQPRYEHAPSWDYGSWETYKYGYGASTRPDREAPSKAEMEILFRLERLEQMMAMMYKFVEDADAERKFLRIKNVELEKFKASLLASAPEQSQVPLA